MSQIVLTENLQNGSEMNFFGVGFSWYFWFFAGFLAKLNFVVITTNYIVIQSSNARLHCHKNSAKDNTFMLFLRF